MRIIAALFALIALVNTAHAGYVKAPPSGLTAFDATFFARAQNKQGNIVMFPPRCVSSCAIAWNFTKRKCVIGYDNVMLEQHEFSANGEKINVRSKDKSYWLRLGRQGQPSWDMVRWYENARKCPSAEANRDSFKGKGLRPRVY